MKLKKYGNVRLVFVSDFLNNTAKNLLKLITYLKKQQDEDDENDMLDKLAKDVNKMIKELNKAKTRTELIELSTGRLQCNDFETKLNINHDYYPIIWQENTFTNITNHILNEGLLFFILLSCKIC